MPDQVPTTPVPGTVAVIRHCDADHAGEGGERKSEDGEFHVCRSVLVLSRRLYVP